MAWILYLAAFMLFSIPLIEVAAQLGFAMRLDNLQWRTGAVGVLSSSMLTPALGLIMAIVTAYASGHDVAFRVMSWLAGVAALMVIALSAAFLLDGWQLRSGLAEQSRRPFSIAMSRALMSMGVVVVVLLGTWIRCLKASRRAEARRSQRSEIPVMPRV